MVGLPPCAGPALVSGYRGADCGIDMSGTHGGTNLAVPLIEKTEEDPATCPIGQQAGDLDKG
jgi:hypothetical protein